MHFRPLTVEGHWRVEDDDGRYVGRVAKVDDGWRGYDVDGDELPGAPVIRTRAEMGDILDRHFREVKPGLG